MKDIVNVVVDLETMSLRPDAAIVSMAAVPFDPECGADGALFLEEGSFYEVVNATTCALHGMRFDMDTVSWWAARSEEEKAELLSLPPLGIGEAMESFHAFLEGLKEKYGAELHVWAQGSDFDIPVLKSAYFLVLPGVVLPWSHGGLRDSRTFILETLGMIYGREDDPYARIPVAPDGEEWVHHSALGDARRTAWNISYCRGLWRNVLEATSSGLIRR